MLVNLLDEPSVNAWVPGTLADIAHNRTDLQDLVFKANGFRKLWKSIATDCLEANWILQSRIVRALGVMCQFLSVCRKEVNSDHQVASH